MFLSGCFSLFFFLTDHVVTLIKAATLLKDAGCDTDPDQSQVHFDRANELLVKARVLKPDADLVPILNELEGELATLTAENEEESQNRTHENGHDSTVGSFNQSNDTINNSVYSTPLIKEWLDDFFQFLSFFDFSRFFFNFCLFRSFFLQIFLTNSRLLRAVVVIQIKKCKKWSIR